jgi:hypothetical protein
MEYLIKEIKSSTKLGLVSRTALAKSESSGDKIGVKQ